MIQLQPASLKMGLLPNSAKYVVFIYTIFASTLTYFSAKGQDLHDHGSETNIASQCLYRPGQGLSVVSLYCGFQKVIKIANVFHGVHTIPNNDCSFIRDDCTVEATHLYDWSKCEGRHNCVQMASHGNMEKCGADKASYIQVEYHCVAASEYTTSHAEVTPPEDTEKNDVKTDSTNQDENKTKKGGHMKSVNICGNETLQVGIVSLHSPKYPNQYPASLDCRCEIEAIEETSLMVNFQDIALAMRESLCSDWLLVESIGKKGSRVVTCGDLQQKKKSLDTGSSKLVLHFHSTKQQPKQKLRGFRAHITTKPRTKYKLKCFQTDAKSLQLLASSKDLKNKRLSEKGMMLPPTNFSNLSNMPHRIRADMSNNSSREEMDVFIYWLLLFAITYRSIAF